MKNEFEVWDLVDHGCGCKRPGGVYRHAACKWFDAHARSRRKAYLGEGYEVLEVNGAPT